MDKAKYLDDVGLAHLMSKLKSELDNKMTLDESGKVLASQLPSSVDEVVEFNGIITDAITIQQVGIQRSAPGYVVYCTKNKTFAFATGLEPDMKYYSVWDTRDTYVDDDGNPYSGKLYVDTKTDMLYRWDGNALVEAVTSSIKTIDVADIDNIPANTDDAVTMAKDVLHSRWTLTDGNVSVGVIDMFCDNQKHQLTQVLTTHYVMNNGVLDFSTHNDVKISHYYRSYNISSAKLTNDTGTWSAWQEDLPETLTNAISILSTSISKATTKVDTLSSDMTTVKEELTKDTTLLNSLSSAASSTASTVNTLNSDVTALKEEIAKKAITESISTDDLDAQYKNFAAFASGKKQVTYELTYNNTPIGTCLMFVDASGTWMHQIVFGSFGATNFDTPSWVTGSGRDVFRVFQRGFAKGSSRWGSWMQAGGTGFRELLLQISSIIPSVETITTTEVNTIWNNN